MEWDEVNGVWKGNAAPTTLEDIPDPLYIFGYGSLLWKPGDMMSKYPSFPCACTGFIRLFAQRSMDHRGTSDFPGFVVTLVKEDELREYNSRQQQEGYDVVVNMNDGMFLPECIGNVYLVPKDEAQSLIDELDFREKGGYHRHLISVRLLKSTPFHSEQEWATALVYTGSVDNPNFSIQNKSSVASVLASAIGQSGENAEYFLNLTQYIRSYNLSEGYLWELEREMLLRMCCWRAKWYMRRLGLTAASWDILRFESQPENRGDDISSSGSRVRLVGWGSNEYQQLEEFTRSFDKEGEDIIRVAKELKSVIFSNSIADDDKVTSVDLSFPSKLICGGSMSGLLTDKGLLYLWGGPRLIQKNFCSAMSLLNSVTDGNKSFLNEKNSTAAADDSASHLNILRNVADATLGHEALLALLKNGRVISIGQNTHGECAPPPSSTSSTNALSDEVSAWFLSFSPTTGIQTHLATSRSIDENDSEEIVYLAAGVRQSVAVSRDGRVYTWGDSRYLLPQSHMWRPPRPTPIEAENELSKETVSRSVLRSDSAGSSNNDTVGHEFLISNQSIPTMLNYHLNVPIYIMNASCGAKHTVLVDNIGRIWTFGDNTYGQLGRDNSVIDDSTGSGVKRLRRTVDLQPTEISIDGKLLGDNNLGTRWLKVSCGWSHNVAKGVNRDGTFVFICWGRCDMGQLPYQSTTSESSASEPSVENPPRWSAPDLSRSIPYPVILPCPASEKVLREVWCGSEYTIACDTAGHIWGCGWNEHGNLSSSETITEPRSDSPDAQPSGLLFVKFWTPIMRDSISADKRDSSMLDQPQLQLAEISEGSLSTGGAHCLAFATM